MSRKSASVARQSGPLCLSRLCDPRSAPSRERSMHRLHDRRISSAGDALWSQAILTRGPSIRQPELVCGTEPGLRQHDLTRARTGSLEVSQWPARHNERVLPRPALDLKMSTERADEQHRFHRYWEAGGALLATRSHRLTYDLPSRRWPTTSRRCATSDARSPDRGRARDRRQTPPAAATVPAHCARTDDVRCVATPESRSPASFPPALTGSRQLQSSTSTEPRSFAQGSLAIHFDEE